MGRAERLYIGILGLVLGIAVAGILYGYLIGVGIDALQSMIISFMPTIAALLIIVSAFMGKGDSL